MKGLLGCIAAAALFAAPAAQAQHAPYAQVVFRPAGPWVADYGEDYCRLSRTFSAGQSEVSVALERLQPGPSVRLIVVGEGMRPFRGADRVGYAFEPAGASGEAGYVRSAMADGRPFLSLDPVVLAPPAAGTATGALPAYDRAVEQEIARGITGLAFDEGLRAPVRVETGSLRAPVEALQLCIDNLLAGWGLDAEKHKAMTAPPILDPAPAGVLPQRTVPFLDRLKLGGGTNQVQLFVGADGRVTDCRIHSPSLRPSVNERICRLSSERASFVPARDADGRPMASLWTGSPLELLAARPRATSVRGGLVGSSSVGPTWGLTAPPSDAPVVTLNTTR